MGATSLDHLDRSGLILNPVTTITSKTLDLLSRQFTQQNFVAKPTCSNEPQLPQGGQITLSIHISVMPLRETEKLLRINVLVIFKSGWVKE